MGKSDSKFFAACGAFAVGLALVVRLIAACFRWLRRPGSLRKVLFALTCFITLIALFYAEEDARGKWAWNRFKRQWEARGEKFDLASFAPPAVPDDQNFALTPIMFSTYGSMIDKAGHEIDPRNTNLINRLDLNIYREHDYSGGTNGSWIKGTLTDLRGWQNYYRTAPTNQNGRVSTNEFPTSSQPQLPAEDVLLALSKFDSTVEELRQASRMPYSRFPLEYNKDDPSMILLPHLARLKQSGQFLELRALAELQTGQSEQSAADIKLTCYLIDAYRTEPFLISQLVRIAMSSYVLQPVYEGLAGHNWSDAQLVALDAELAKFDFLSDYQWSMRSEAAGTAKMVEYIKRTRKISPFLDMFNDGQKRGLIDLVCYLSPAGWFHQNQIQFSEFCLQQCVPVVDVNKREVSPTAAKRAQENLDEITAHPAPYNALQYIFFSQIRKWVFDKNASADRFARGQASVDLARVGIALERYNLAHHAYPESLDALVPQFIQKLPHDVMGGQPLKYRRTNDSFVLYSIGWNEKDDGGVAALKHSGMYDETPLQSDPDSGDWVWAYPKK